MGTPIVQATDYVSLFIVFIQRNMFATELFIIDVIIATILDFYAIGVILFEYNKNTMVPDED